MVARAKNGDESVAYSMMIKSFLQQISSKPVEMAMKMKELSDEDPRRVAHFFKVALALTVVSLMYYVYPVYRNFGNNAMWAILTVVVVFDFSVGGTLGKGLNMMVATLIGSLMGLGAYEIAYHTRKTAEPVILGLFVFFIASISTFLRFFPGMKARYDYALVIFNLSFCLVSISGYRDTDVVMVALQRVCTIILGSLIAMVICLCICPVWSGRELHNLIASNLEKLGDFLETGFVLGYLHTPMDGQSTNRFEPSRTAYRTILTSKNNEETLANLARWELGHGRFKFRHPWNQYLAIGTLARECAYKIESLNNFMDSENPSNSGDRRTLQEPVTHISTESGRVLKELAFAVRKMTRPTPLCRRIANLKSVCDDLRKSCIKSAPCSWNERGLLEISSVLFVHSILRDLVICIEKISKAVDELATMANFAGVCEPVQANFTTQRYLPPVRPRGAVKPIPGDDDGTCGHVVMVARAEPGSGK